MSDMISLKITINNGRKRRLNVLRDTTFEAVNNQIKEMLPTDGDLHWRYVDEENELIDLSTNSEWSLAVRSCPPDTLMRLFIDVIPKPAQPPLHPQQESREFKRACCTSRFGRIAVPMLLFWSIFTHPIITAIAIAITGYVTFHHYPSTFNSLTSHAQRHWRKIGALYALTFLFSCRLCTIFFALPLMVLAYKKLKAVVKRNRHALVGGARCFAKHATDVMADVQEKAKVAAEQVIASAIASANEAAKSSVVQPTAPAQAEVYPSCQDTVPSAPVAADLYPELPVSEEEIEGEYATQANTLSELGFKNHKLNLHLLRNFNGEIDKVVNSLLSLSAYNQ